MQAHKKNRPATKSPAVLFVIKFLISHYYLSGRLNGRNLGFMCRAADAALTAS
jgi:hypothetical protein